MKRKLLIIEDDEQVRLVVRQFLKRKDWEFHGAGSGQEGLEKSSSLLPDLIVLDVQLPDMEGWDICRRLKDDPVLKAIPVIMVSGNYLDPTHKARGLEAGADDFLAKPFDMTELLLRMNAILRSRGR